MSDDKESEVNLGGRPVGSTQDTVNARKSLKILTDLHKNVNSDVLDAYDVLIKMLNDSSTKDSVRKSIAKDVIALYMDFASDAGDVLGKPKNRHQEKERQLGDVAKTTVVRFSKNSV